MFDKTRIQPLALEMARKLKEDLCATDSLSPEELNDFLNGAIFIYATSFSAFFNITFSMLWHEGIITEQHAKIAMHQVSNKLIGILSDQETRELMPHSTSTPSEH